MRYGGCDVAKKRDAGRGRQGSNFAGVGVEELQALEARCVEVIGNVFGEVGADFSFCETQAWSPFAGDLVEACGLKSVVAGLLKDCHEFRRRFLQCVLTNGPEGEDERLACAANPFFYEIERVIAGANRLE